METFEEVIMSGKRIPLMAAIPGELPERIGWIDIDDMREGTTFEGKFLESNTFAKYVSVDRIGAFVVEVGDDDGLGSLPTNREEGRPMATEIEMGIIVTGYFPKIEIANRDDARQLCDILRRNGISVNLREVPL